MANEYYQQDRQTQQMPQHAQQQYQQQYYQQSQYQQYPPRQFNLQRNVTSTGQWMLTLFLMCIPIVDIVLLFVWAFGSNTEPSKKNWARATLIWAIIGIIVAIVLAVIVVVLGVDVGQYLYWLPLQR